MTVIDWQLATNSCVHRHVYGCKMICGSISKNLRAISTFFFFFPRQRVENRSGLQTAVVLPWEWTGIWEEASRPIARARWWGDLCVYSTGFSDCTLCDPWKSREREDKGPWNFPEKPRGFILMAPRHIYNPTIQRGWGRFPVQLSSCAIPLFGSRSSNDIQYQNVHSSIVSQAH